MNYAANKGMIFFPFCYNGLFVKKKQVVFQELPFCFFSVKLISVKGGV